jgi:hypothetical protein
MFTMLVPLTFQTGTQALQVFADSPVERTIDNSIAVEDAAQATPPDPSGRSRRDGFISVVCIFPGILIRGAVASPSEMARGLSRSRVISDCVQGLSGSMSARLIGAYVVMFK